MRTPIFKLQFPNSQSGQSLLEVLLAIALFIAGAATIGVLVQEGSVSIRQGLERSKAVFLAEEGLEAARSIRQTGFNNLTVGTHGIALSGGAWTFSGGSDQTEQFLRTVIIEDIEVAKKRITSEVTWQFSAGRTGAVTLVTYLANFLQKLWLQTTFAEFSAGKKNSVLVTNNAGGEVELALSGDWTQGAAYAAFDTDGGGDVNDIVTDGDILYAGAGSTSGDNFTAIDISDISSGVMTKAGGVSISGDITSVSVSNGYAFLATTNNSQEVVVVRLSDYSIVNTLDLPRGADALASAISGATLFIGRFSSGDPELYEINISSPESPLSASNSLDINGSVNAITIYNGYASLATTDTSGELVVVRLSDFTQVNSLDLPGGAATTDIANFASDLYITRISSGDPEAYRIDVSNPEGPLAVSASAQISGNANGVTVQGDGRVYLATSDSSRHLSVRDAVSLSETGTAAISSTPNDVAFFGGFAYLATGNNSQEIVAVRGGFGGWEAPTLVGNYNTAGNIDALGIYVSGNYTYLVTGNNSSGAEFSIVDTSTPSSPVLAGSLELGTAVNSVFVSGNFAYLATQHNSKELIVVNVTNKTAPFEAGNYNAPGSQDGLSIAVTGTTAFLGTANSSGAEVFALNVSVPTSIALLGSYEAGNAVNGIWIDGANAYLATANNSSEFQVVNISNPVSMSQTALYNTPGGTDANGVYASAGKAYLASDNGGNDLYIFDVSALPTVSLLGSIDLFMNANDVFIADGKAFIAGSNNATGLTVVDVSNPASPSILSVFDTDGAANGVIYSGPYAFLATANDARELQIVGEGAAPTERVREGRFISSTFDSGNAATAWQTITWTASGTGSAQLQLRTADAEANLPSAKWVGPDGTSNTFYTVPDTAIITDPGASGTQWVQYKVFFSGNGSNTPVLEDVTLVYN